MPSPPPRRAWGTRYDSLVDTPPLGSPLVSSPDVALHLRSATGTVHVERESRDPDATHASAEKGRSSPDPDYSDPSSVVVQNNIDTCSPIQARMPHDASVFVASLPSHIPEAELQVLLSEHLSQHANIKHIKLIRDNRGAVCAFVQVESASQASNLIAACGLSPFMDRHIRCEKARAFRTLLVSWRPTVSSTQASNDLQGRAQGGAEISPLRLRRCRGTKYIQVNLGSEAISSDPAQLPNYTPPRPDDPLSGSGILFPGGLKEGDLKCLKTLLEAFGPLEFITPFEAATHVTIPPPHASTYASEFPSGEERAFMRGGSAFASIKDVGDENSEHARPQPPMWAVKWEHRNDAVSAITALQYVPSLFVCWSHTYGRPHHPPYSQLGPYGHSRNPSGLHMQQPSHPSTCGINDTNATHPYPQVAHVGEREANAQWAVVPMASGTRLQQLHTQPPTGIIKTEQHQDPITFSESDFPPLGGEGSGIAAGRGRGKKGAWLGRRSFVRSGAPSPPPISTTINAARMHTEPNTPTSAVLHTPDLESVVEPSPVTPGFPVTPRTPPAGYAPHADEMRKDAMYASAQGYTVPYSSVPGYIPPIAPRQGYIVQQTFPAPYVTPHAYPLGRETEEFQLQEGRELFIGGLDMETWDEERVRNVFGQYGTIEEMRFVKPGYHAPVHRRAFAFVKFTDYGASQKAIKEEHMRVYDDRKIKVQLRDVNPPRRWGYRGRGRFNQGHLRTDRGSPEFDHDSSMCDVDNGTEGGEPDDNGHVRFASAPEAGRIKVEPADDVHLNQDNTSENTSCQLENGVNTRSMAEAAQLGTGGHGETASSELQTKHETGPVGSSCSDGTPDASGMEVQNHSADTTLTFADVTVTQTSPPAESTHHELQSEPDSQTVTSTPPQSNPDAASIYAPSSAGSAPINNGYYAQPPSWIPPYAMPPTSYGPYGYYPQQVAGQPIGDGSNPYPWMAAVYRNVVPCVPWFNPPPGVELAPAPVRPTGYIQREPGGIFIPVYPPERLGQYMSTSGTAVDQSQAQPHSGASTIGNWQNLTPHPQLYPVPFPMQQTMIMPQQAPVTGQQPQPQHPQQLPLASNGWISAPPPGTTYPTLAPSSAPPPYPAPKSYYPSQAPSVPASSGRAGVYGQHDSTMHQTSMKGHHRRGTDYGHQQHRNPGGGPREGRTPHHRRSLGASGMNGAADHTFPVSTETHWQTKPNAGAAGRDL